ncbi:MAG: C2H2-type zinc finger protein [Parcubacteria group bacterium]|jgi:hypothetical protein
MKYRILTTKGSRWGEGWQYGDIVEMDFPAARVPLMNGEIEEVKEEIKKEVNPEKETEEGFKCEVCGKVCKNKIGLQSHMRTHK